MEASLILALVAVTSLTAYVAARRWLGLHPTALGGAGTRALECVAPALVFLAANLGFGVLAVLAYRTLSGHFVTVYLINDVAIIFLSVLQALVLRWWWDTGD
jgi:hypothetical protein